jgi:hypothetical protein
VLSGVELDFLRALDAAKKWAWAADGVTEMQQIFTALGDDFVQATKVQPERELLVVLDNPVPTIPAAVDAQRVAFESSFLASVFLLS